MAITVEKRVVKVETTEDGRIGYKLLISVMEGGVLLSHNNHRGVLEPGQAIADIPALVGVDNTLLETEKTAHHTPAKIQAFKAKEAVKQAARDALRPTPV